MQQNLIEEEKVETLPESQPLPSIAPLTTPDLFSPNVVPLDSLSGSVVITQQIQRQEQRLGYDSDGDELEDLTSNDEPQQEQPSMLVDGICEAAANIGEFTIAGAQAAATGTVAVASGLHRAGHALLGVATDAFHACCHVANETPAVVSSIAETTSQVISAANVFAPPSEPKRSPPKKMLTRKRRRIILEEKKVTKASIRKSKRGSKK